MSQEDSAGVLFRGPDGAMYWISTTDLQAFRMPDEDAAKAAEFLGGEESVQGFAAPRQVGRPLPSVSLPRAFVIEGPVNPDAPTDRYIKVPGPRPR
jgi:hypothetical protein